ncbi:hypothetical protein BTR23_03580 [Alkalihalophilus pseudofirmus]|nr:hypothetical protein BTR23_03580 [Alkalihalophilus pseudofirmus]
MKNTDYQIYVSGAFKLGLGFGIVSLLSRWVTGNTFLSSPETLIKYGLTGAIGFSVMGALALILFGFLAKKIRENYPDHLTIGDVLRQRLTPSGYWYMIFILLLTSLISLFVQTIGAGLLIHLLFPVPVVAGMFIFLLFCFFIGGFGGMPRLHQLASINVVLIFSAVIIIQVYFFIQEGIYPVYEGIRLYHPYLFYISNTDAIWFIFTIIFIFFGQVIIDRATWQRVFIIKKEKVRMAFTLAGLVWATIPLALTALLMIILFGRSFDTIYSLLFEVAGNIQSALLISLFVLFCFSAISSAFSADLHATNTLITRNILELFRPLTNKEKWQYTYIFSGVICVISLIVVSIFTPNPLELLFFFGHFYSALIAPMVYIIVSKKKLPFIIPFASFIGALGGYATLPIVKSLVTIWVSFAISSFICLCFYVYKSFLANKDSDKIS